MDVALPSTCSCAKEPLGACALERSVFLVIVRGKTGVTRSERCSKEDNDSRGWAAVAAVLALLDPMSYEICRRRLTNIKIRSRCACYSFLIILCVDLVYSPDLRRIDRKLTSSF